jgi:hypothetical protein
VRVLAEFRAGRRSVVVRAAHAAAPVRVDLADGDDGAALIDPAPKLAATTPAGCAALAQAFAEAAEFLRSMRGGSDG